MMLFESEKNFAVMSEDTDISAGEHLLCGFLCKKM